MSPGKPVVVGERVRKPRERAYPPVVVGHPWSMKGIDGRLDFLLTKTAEEKARNHCLENPAIEVMGLLVGEVFSDEGGEYAVAMDVITAPLRSDAVHVEFDHDSIDALAEELDGACADWLVLGWYHSHPGHGCFLSDTDVATQKGSFQSPLAVALVIDPIALQMCVFRVAGDEVGALPVGVWVQRHEDPFHLPDIVATHGRYAS